MSTSPGTSPSETWLAVLIEQGHCTACGWQSRHGRNPLMLRAVADKPSYAARLARAGSALSVVQAAVKKEYIICRSCWRYQRLKRGHRKQV